MSGVVDIYGTTPRLGRRSMALADIDPKYVSQSGIWEASEVETSRGSIRIQHLTAVSAGPRPLSCSVTSGGSVGPLSHNQRFPKLEECAHFHYDVLELPSLKINLRPEEPFKCAGNGNGDEVAELYTISIEVVSGGQCWVIRRTHANLCKLDEQLHRCVWDRSFSQLERVDEIDYGSDEQHDEFRELTQHYVNRLGELPTNQITCGSVLGFFEIDNRGRHIVSSEDSAINTPAVAAACAVRKYVAQAADELSFEVGDMISVIDMPPPEESTWWRGKRKFHVGFFPRECVQVIGEKVPMGLPIVPSTRKLQRLSVSSTASSGSSSPEKPVLRKHGKLIAFFRSFILSRPSRRRLKQSGILRERVFSCDLAEHLLNSETEIPVVLKCCSEFIETHGIVDGIYRLSGITSNIQKLRIAFDEDRIPNLEEDNAIKQDIHAVSSLLKMYFRELPNPLCTYQLYEKFVGAAQSSDQDRLFRMREVAQELPPPHFRTLEYLLKHLARVAEKSDQTGMTPKNMAIVWAPNLIRCKELEAGGVAALKGIGVQAVVTEYLIRFADLIFSDKLTSVFPETTSVISSSCNPPGRPKSLAISSPMRLMSLEEAQDKAKDESRYIDVGGGPANLPPKYHTVLDIPGRRSSMKSKRSPLGWKHFFSRNRSFSKPPRKGPNPDITVVTKNTPPVVQQGLQPTWVGRLRPVKSVESLVSPPLYQSSVISALGNTLEVDESQLEEVEVHATSQSSPISPVTDDDINENDSQENDLDSRPIQNSKTHNRSISHDSYFEFGEFLKKNAVYIDETLEEENSQTESKASLDSSSEMESAATSPRKSSGAFGDCESASMSSPRNMNRVSFGSPMTPPISIPSLKFPSSFGVGVHSSSSDEFNNSAQPENESETALSKSPLLKPKPRYSLLRNMEVQTSMTKLTDVGVSTTSLECGDLHRFVDNSIKHSHATSMNTDEFPISQTTFREIGEKFELDRNSSIDDSSTDTTPGGDPYTATNIIYSPLVNEIASPASSIEKVYNSAKFAVPKTSLFVCPLYESGIEDKSTSELTDTAFKCYKTRIHQYENLDTILDSLSEDESDKTTTQIENTATSTPNVNEYENQPVYQNDEFQQSQISIVKLEGPISEADSLSKEEDLESQNLYENWENYQDGETEDVENSYESVIYEDVGNQYEEGDDDDDKHCYETVEVNSALKQGLLPGNRNSTESHDVLTDNEEESAYEDVRFVTTNKKEFVNEQSKLVIPQCTSNDIQNGDMHSLTAIVSSSSNDSLEAEKSVLTPENDLSSPLFTEDMVTYLEIEGQNYNIKIRNNCIEEQESQVQKMSSSDASPSTEDNSEIRHIDSPLVVDNPLYGLQVEEVESNGNYLNSLERFHSFEDNPQTLQKLVVRCNSAPLSDKDTDAGRDFALDLAIRTLNDIQSTTRKECEDRTLPQSHSMDNNTYTTENTQNIQLLKRMSEPSLLSKSKAEDKSAWKIPDAKRLTHRKSSVKELLSKFEQKDSLSPSPSPTHAGPGLPRPDSRVSTTLRQKNNSNATRFQHHRFSMGDILMTQSMSSAEEGSEGVGMVRSDTFPELRTESAKENGTCSELDQCTDGFQDCDSSTVAEKVHHALRVAMSSVDMNDPSTRERIEKYKEERRIFLRQKINSELSETRPPTFSSDSKCSIPPLKSPDRSSYSSVTSVENDCVFQVAKNPEEGKKFSSSESPRKRAFSEDVSPGLGYLNQTKSIKTESVPSSNLKDNVSNKVDEVNVREKVALWSTSEKRIHSHSTSSFTEIVTTKPKPGLREATSLPIEDFASETKQPHQLLFRRDIVPASLEITKAKLVSTNRNAGADTGPGKKIKDMAAFFERKQF